jgi:hypothetical protein
MRRPFLLARFLLLPLHVRLLWLFAALVGLDISLRLA